MRQRVINSLDCGVATQGLIGVHGVEKGLMEGLIEIYVNVKSVTENEGHQPSTITPLLFPSID